MTNKESDSHKLARSFIDVQEGSYVQFKEDIYRITQQLGLDSIIGVDVETGIAKKLPLNELKAVNDISDNGFIHRDLEDISDDDWKELSKRLKIIRPLLSRKSHEDILKRSEKCNVSRAKIYRLLKAYTETGNVISLLPKKRGVSKGTVKINKEAEAIIARVIDDHYLKSQRPAVQHMIEIVDFECEKLKIKPPSKNTIRRRIGQISEHLRIKRQGMRSLARTKFEPVPGKFPEPRFPLDVVQIDHTPMDVIIVDDENRQPIGRPWITVAIDVYSRVVVGFYLSLDAPSGTSVAMCLAHAINTKDKWLDKYEVDARWPVWGVMNTIHVDNGADFRAETLKRSCLLYDINIEFRPVKKTNYGGHIERYLGTLLRRVHSIPGTTFSSIKDRLEYDSDKNAVITFSELEKWLTIYISKFYHESIHSSLDVSPLKKWEVGMLSDDASGYPPIPTDPDRILLDFLPIIERTVQKTGVNIDGLNYYEHILRPYINQQDPLTKRGQKHIFRRDPRDITYIWFYEKSTQEYYKIPLALLVPSLNLWELKEAKNHLKKQNREVDDHSLMQALEEMRNIVDTAKVATKKKRRKKQQKKEHQKSLTQNSQTPSPTPPSSDDGWGDAWDD